VVSVPSQRSPQQYPSADPDSPVTWCDLVSILDSHGLTLSPHGKGARSPEAKLVRRLFKAWVKASGVRPGLPYVMPLRVLSDTVSREHPHLIRRPDGGVSWAVVVDAINDPNGGLQIVRRRYSCRSAA
jgi:hypothetical protein